MGIWHNDSDQRAEMARVILTTVKNQNAISAPLHRLVICDLRDHVLTSADYYVLKPVYRDSQFLV